MLLPIDPLIAFRLVGIRVTVRCSTVLVLAIVSAGAMAGMHDGRSVGTWPWLGGTLIVLLGLTGALLGQASAELRACRPLGIRADRIHLRCFGGAATTRDDSVTPRSEALVGAAGLVPLLLAGGGLGAVAIAEHHRLPGGADTLPALAIAVGAIATVQIFPALGLGGGRILRSLIWYLTDNPLTGAQAGALYAHLIGAAMMAVGIGLLSLDGPRPYWGLWAIIAGWQLSGAARLDVYRIRWRQLAKATTLAELLLPATTLAATTRIDAAIEPLLGGGPDAPLLLTADDGRPIGLLRFENLRGARRAEWDQRTVASVMTPLAALPRLSADCPVHDALDLLDERNAPAVIVTAPGDPNRTIAAVGRRQILGRLHDRRRE